MYLNGKSFQRVFCLLLVFCMMFTLFSPTAFAESIIDSCRFLGYRNTYDGAPWRLYADGTLVVDKGYIQSVSWPWRSPWWFHRDRINKIHFTGPVVGVSSLKFLFSGLSNVTSIEGLEYFDTSNVTIMSHMFSVMEEVTVLDISGFDVSNVKDMSSMFWGAASLRQLTLGENFTFVGGGEAELPQVLQNDTYTGYWQNVGSGTVSTPQGQFVLTSTELMETYDGATMADTWVWQRQPIPTTAVSICGTDTRNLTIGQTLPLAATVAPADATNQNVVWSSSNPAVATVNELGLVRAVSVGSTTITVATVDGGHTASLTLVVTIPKPPPTNPTDVSPTPKPPLVNFTDVCPNAWYRPYIESIAAQNIMHGTGNGLFSPNMDFSRAMLAVTLWRMEEQPLGGVSFVFRDVAADRWYTHAIAWAFSESIAKGVGSGMFVPRDAVTREQFATMLFRYARAKGHDVTVSPNFDWNHFSDRDAVSSWAVDAMRWAVYNNLITGTTSTTLASRSTTTRAHSAAILTRFMELFVVDP